MCEDQYIRKIVECTYSSLDSEPGSKRMVKVASLIVVVSPLPSRRLSELRGIRWLEIAG